MLDYLIGYSSEGVVQQRLAQEFLGQSLEMKDEAIGKRLVDLASHVILTSQEGNSREYLKSGWNQLSKMIKFLKLETIYSRVESGESWQSFKKGLSPSTSWKDQSQFWKTLSDTLYVSRIGIIMMGKIPFEMVDMAGSIGVMGNLFSIANAKNVADMLDRLRDYTQVHYHSAKISSELNSNAKAGFETTTQKVAKASSVIGSFTSLGKVAAEYAGMPTVAMGLGLTSAFFAGIKFYSRWNAEKAGTELKKIAAEFVVALNQLKSDCVKTKNGLKSSNIKRIHGEISQLEEKVKHHCNYRLTLKDLVAQFEEIKQETDKLGIGTDDFSKKAKSFIAKANDTIEKQVQIIEKKFAELFEHNLLLLGMDAEISKLMKSLSEDKGYEEHVRVHIGEGLQKLRETIDEDLTEISQTFSNPPENLDISEWLEWVERTVSQDRKSYLEASIIICSQPPSFIDEVHI